MYYVYFRVDIEIMKPNCHFWFHRHTTKNKAKKNYLEGNDGNKLRLWS